MIKKESNFFSKNIHSYKPSLFNDKLYLNEGRKCCRMLPWSILQYLWPALRDIWTCCGKGWPLGSRLWCLIVKLSLSHWYPGSGVVVDFIDSWTLPSFLLWKPFSVFLRVAVLHRFYCTVDSKNFAKVKLFSGITLRHRCICIQSLKCQEKIHLKNDICWSCLLQIIA